MSTAGAIVELLRNSLNWSTVVESIVKLERKIFPKHESLARSFDEELRKKNTGLLYVEVDGEVSGYVMYSWPSSLCASITKLAGSKTHFLSLTLFPFFIFIFIYIHTTYDFICSLQNPIQLFQNYIHIFSFNFYLLIVISV